MDHDLQQERRQVHSLIDLLPPAKLEAVRNLLEVFLDEGGDTLSSAEATAVAASDEWLKHNKPIPHEEVLAELGLSMADWERDEPRTLTAMAKRIVWSDLAKADIRGIEQSVAIQILKTLGRYVISGEGATKQLKGISPPLIRLRAQNHRIFFRERGDHLEIARVLDRKEAYR